MEQAKKKKSYSFAPFNASKSDGQCYVLSLCEIISGYAQAQPVILKEMV